MISLVYAGLSVGVEFHLYRGFGLHRYCMFGVRRHALVFGGFTVDVVSA